MSNNRFAMSARRGIIWIGKYAPFVVTAITTISNIEALYAVIFGVYTKYGESVIYYKPISWWIGERFELDNAWLLVLTTLSVGVEACMWNRLCIAFLALLLWQKQYFIEHTIDETSFGGVLLINSVLGLLLVYKGIRMLIATKK